MVDLRQFQGHLGSAYDWRSLGTCASTEERLFMSPEPRIVKEVGVFIREGTHPFMCMLEQSILSHF